MHKLLLALIEPRELSDWVWIENRLNELMTPFEEHPWGDPCLECEDLMEKHFEDQVRERFGMTPEEYDESAQYNTDTYFEMRDHTLKCDYCSKLPKTYFCAYEIGGNWSGELSAENFETTRNPKIRVKCWKCKGKGKLAVSGNDAIVCPRCHGEKKTVSKSRYEHAWKPRHRDITTVRHGLYMLQKYEFGTHNLLTPDGKWHKNSYSNPTWDEKYLERQYEKYIDHTLIVVDLYV